MRLITFIKDLKYLPNKIKWFMWSLKHINFYMKFRPYDYSIIMNTLEYQLKLLCDYIEKHGYEVEEHRMEKVKRMKRCLELMKNIRESDYIERVGIKNDDMSTEFVYDSDKKSYHIVCEYKDENEYTNKINESRELEEKEWNELFDILKEDMRGWWD